MFTAVPHTMTLSIAFRQLGTAHQVAVAETTVSVRAGAETLVAVDIEADPLCLVPLAAPGVVHFLRLADATLIPLPPEHEGIRHRLVAWQLARVQPGGLGTPLRLPLDAGDAYIAVAGSSLDSPAIARFIHLRDYFNAERLADALSHELRVLTPDPGADATLIVLEARPDRRL
jgi:hypothetical protein